MKVPANLCHYWVSLPVFNTLVVFFKCANNSYMKFQKKLKTCFLCTKIKLNIKNNEFSFSKETFVKKTHNYVSDQRWASFLAWNRWLFWCISQFDNICSVLCSIAQGKEIIASHWKWIWCKFPKSILWEPPAAKRHWVRHRDVDNVMLTLYQKIMTNSVARGILSVVFGYATSTILRHDVTLLVANFGIPWKHSRLVNLIEILLVTSSLYQVRSI